MENRDPQIRRKTSPIALLLLGLALIGIGFISGWLISGGRQAGYVPTSPPAQTGNSSQAAKTKPANWQKLNRIKDQIYEIYNGPIDENKLLEGAVKGMVNSLGDPYSQFYNAQEYKELNQQSTGKFVGVGIQISVVEDQIVVVAPIDGSPAKKAGIMAGDVLIKIDGRVYTGKDVDAAASHMRGEAGKPVKLTVRRDTEEKEFEIVRAEITTKSVKQEMLDGQIGYITLSQFTKDSDKEVKTALDGLREQGAKGYILDLRGNPGGYLNESIRIASNFIKKGEVVVSTKDKNGNEKKDVSVGGQYIGTPLVVLIDVGSASASEVVSGALKDYGAAVLVGQKTYGKGIVQTIMDLPEGEGLKLTVAAYYSPKGTNIHKIGIQPDVPVEMPKDLTPQTYTKEKDTQLQKAIEIMKEKLK